MSEQLPVGWHPDGQGNERYWDGTTWTEQIRPSDEMGVPKKAGALSKLGDAVKGAAVEKLNAKKVLAKKQAEDAQSAGPLVTSGIFGTSTVEIFENGYVRVAKWAEGQSATGPKATDKNTPYEKLRSIKFTQAREESSASTSALQDTVGPALAKLVRGGKGIMKASAPGMAMAGAAHLASNAARKTVLTIATDKQIHTLTNQTTKIGRKVTNTAHDDVGRALEIAGNAVLDVDEADVQAAAAPAVGVPTTPTLTDRMRELADLHKDGILSDEEFADAKARLLAGL